MMIHRVEGNAECPLLEGVAVDAEAIVACEGYEVGVLPVAIALAHTLLDGIRLLREAFCL